MGMMLSTLTEGVPVGTNLDLYLLMWMIVSGRLLASRGAVIPGLAALGLPDAAVRRSWRALGRGSWEIGSLVAAWQSHVRSGGQWQVHEIGGYRPLAVDLVGFYRPRMKGLPTKHYLSSAGKALPAIVLGLVVRVGSVAKQRVPLPAAVLRMAMQTSERTFQQYLLRHTATLMEPQDALVADRGFSQSEVADAGVERYVLRLPANFTARRNELPAYRGRGRPPEYGALVRPLARTYRGRQTPPTPADRQETWIDEGGQLLTARFWDHLVERHAKPDEKPTFTAAAIQDPRFAHPLLLATTLPLTGRQLREFYPDRWPVEVVPLTAKQMLGAVRQFVFGPESRFRLPELTLLLGAVMTYAAATLPAVATGFWDRAPQPTSGRLRRTLAKVDFSMLAVPEGRIRKKNSVTAHLPKGVAAHRRSNAPPAPPLTLPHAA
jgi:hypothetical protein